MSVDIWNCHPWPLDDSRCRCKIHLVTFLYIFLLLDCFKWALIHCIEKWRVHSELCQFQTCRGVYRMIHLVSFLYTFLLVDCFKWPLIDCIEKQRVHSELCQFQTCGGVYRMIHLVSFLYTFLLVDCFKWALIDCIEKQRVHSELCQFQTGGVGVGGISYDSPGLISLYLPISWLFQMSCQMHW